jgi:hypothetical protein
MMKPKSRVGIKPFRQFNGNNRLASLQLNILRWLIHALANFEHHRKSTFVDEVFRLAAFTEEEKTFATIVINETVFRQLRIVNMNFQAFVSESRQQMLNFALSLNNQKAYALYRCFSQKARMPCGIFRFVDLLPKQWLTLLKQSFLSSVLARRLVFDKYRQFCSTKFSRDAELSILSRRRSFDCESSVKPNPFSAKVVGCILPLEFADNGSLKMVRRYYNQTDPRSRSAEHPFLPFRFKCEPDNTVNVYFTANSEILVLSIPFMQEMFSVEHKTNGFI